MKDFRKVLRAECHRSILNCYKAHNQAGGTIVPLQDGTSQHFPKAVILAIYADAPAAVYCTCTGSACPVCYMPKKYMSAPGTDQDDLRTDTNMLRRQAVLKQMVNPIPPRKRVVGASKNAQNRSSMFGIPMKDLTVWSSIKDPDEDWVFGPSRSKDSVYQSTPASKFARHGRRPYCEGQFWCFDDLHNPRHGHQTNLGQNNGEFMRPL